MSRISIKAKKTLGLEKYSNELSLLFRRIIEVSSNQEGIRPEYLHRGVTYDTMALYQFIRKHIE